LGDGVRRSPRQTLWKTKSPNEGETMKKEKATQNSLSSWEGIKKNGMKNAQESEGWARIGSTRGIHAWETSRARRLEEKKGTEQDLQKLICRKGGQGRRSRSASWSSIRSIDMVGEMGRGETQGGGLGRVRSTHYEEMCIKTSRGRPQDRALNDIEEGELAKKKIFKEGGGRIAAGNKI